MSRSGIEGKRAMGIAAVLFFFVAASAALPAEGTDNPTVVPNDPHFGNQISFHFQGGTIVTHRSSRKPSLQELEMASEIHLNAPRAWSITVGDPKIVVAFLDDGFFYRHEDIRANVWHNPGETGRDDTGHPKAVNGLDDDGNGYVDDVIGWDFAFEDPDPDPYVFDGMDRTRIQPYWHSISALGIVGAVGDNGVGVAGINWYVSLMLLKIGAQGTPRGERDLDRPGRAARAIRYAVDNGARVINWSGFVDVVEPDSIEPLEEAVRYAGEHGVLLVVGAGNDALDLDDDANCFYPQCFDHPNVIRVAQLGLDGNLYRYELEGGEMRGSNFGSRRVEIAALGENFTTDLHQGVSTYGIASGTSNAGPVVAGVAALVLSVRPDLDAAALKELLMETAVPRPSLEGKIRSGGVVDAYRAVQRAVNLE